MVSVIERFSLLLYAIKCFFCMRLSHWFYVRIDIFVEKIEIQRKKEKIGKLSQHLTVISNHFPFTPWAFRCYRKAILSKKWLTAFNFKLSRYRLRLCGYEKTNTGVFCILCNSKRLEPLVKRCIFVNLYVVTQWFVYLYAISNDLKVLSFSWFIC